MYVCMYVCMHACMRACVCMCVCMYVCVCMCMYVCLQKYDLHRNIHTLFHFFKEYAVEFFRNIPFCPAIFVCNAMIKHSVIPRPGIKVKLLLEGRPVAASSIFSLCCNGSLYSNRKNVAFITKWNIQCSL